MLDPVTLRYAEALFSLAKREGALDTVRADVERLARELEAPAAAWFFDARVPVEERREKMLALAAGAHAFTRNFVGLAFDKRREDVLRGLGAAFHQRTLDDRGATEGTVESARPLGAAELASLQAALGARLGKDVTLKNEVVPDVLGGVRVIVGSQMMDASVRGRLEGLSKRMRNAPLPQLSDS